MVPFCLFSSMHHFSGQTITVTRVHKMLFHADLKKKCLMVLYNRLKKTEAKLPWLSSVGPCQRPTLGERKLKF